MLISTDVAVIPRKNALIPVRSKLIRQVNHSLRNTSLGNNNMLLFPALSTNPDASIPRVLA